MRFLISSDLKRHKSEKHGIGGRFKCTICSKIFYFSSNLIIHMVEIHKIDGEFQCPDCSSERQYLMRRSRGFIKSYVFAALPRGSNA